MSPKDISTLSRVERKKEETKNRIVAVAIKLFNEQGVEATTMEQIATEVDIAKGTLYNYFPAKEAIIGEFIQQSFEVENPKTILELQKLPNTKTRMLTIMKMLIEGVRQYKDIFEKFWVYQVQRMISFQADEYEKGGIGNLAEAIITFGQKDNEIRKDLPNELLINMFEFVFIEIVKQFYLKPEINISEVIEQCVELYINGVKYEAK
jgi:AcrR family transcriptional regulator